MIVRLGFVAMSLCLENASPSKTMTYKSYQPLSNDESRLFRLKKITKENLLNTYRIMAHAHVHDVQLYRITSKLVPLATHPEVISWDYTTELADEFQKIEHFIKRTGMRISAHPDHFTLLTSSRKEVTAASIRDLIYHDRILSAMGVGSEGKLVLHIGGTYKDKEKAIGTFVDNYSSLPCSLQNRIILENDDKSYTASETLALCQRLQIPMVFDAHHHLCNPDEFDVEDLLNPIFETWKGQDLLPKIHYSTPKSPASIRSHADNIDSNAFYEFLQQARSINHDFDVMLEAKNKDAALFQLIEELKQYQDLNVLNGASIEL